MSRLSSTTRMRMAGLDSWFGCIVGFCQRGFTAACDATPEWHSNARKETSFGAQKKKTREGVIGETPCPGPKFYRCPDCRNRRYPRGGAHRSWPDQPRHREIKNPLKRRKAAVIFSPWQAGVGGGAD